MIVTKVSRHPLHASFYFVTTKDGKRLLCSDEIVVKYGIQAGADFNHETFAAIMRDAQRAQAMDMSLRLLGMQPRSRGELADKLKLKKIAPAVIEAVLARIGELGYLNDETFARNRAALLSAQGKGPELI